MVDGRLSVELEMFTRGGLAVLNAIEAMGCDTLHQRPTVSKGRQALLFGRSLLTYLVGLERKSEKSERIPVTFLAEQSTPETSVVIDDSYTECHRFARASRGSFYHAFFLLPKTQRHGLS